MSKVRTYNYFLVVSFLFLFPACSTPPEGVGTSSIDSVMIEIFVDIHLTNARTELGLGGDPVSLDSILTRHGLTMNDYNDQLGSYSLDSDTYLLVLNKVIERIGEEARFVSDF